MPSQVLLLPHACPSAQPVAPSIIVSGGPSCQPKNIPFSMNVFIEVIGLTYRGIERMKTSLSGRSSKTVIRSLFQPFSTHEGRMEDVGTIRMFRQLFSAEQITSSNTKHPHAQLPSSSFVIQRVFFPCMFPEESMPVREKSIFLTFLFLIGIDSRPCRML